MWLINSSMPFFLFKKTEVKELKRRVRDVVQPDRELGHVDRKKDSLAVIEREKNEEGRCLDC